MSAWAGLGYYSRARNLHTCARRVTAEYSGELPADEAELRKLPGIGPYTAAAIAAVAFGRHAAPVDGNIERVLARLCAVRKELPAAKPELRKIAEVLAPQKRAGDFAQAMMDLGATVCTPKSPDCEICPWRNSCSAKELGLERLLPARSARKVRPLRRGAAFFVISDSGEILLRRRPPSGLLGGMHETPMSPWNANFPRDPLDHAPMKLKFRLLSGLVYHTFTHFELELQVYHGEIDARQKRLADGEWVPFADIERSALPSVMRKVIDHALCSPKARASATSRTTKRTR